MSPISNILLSSVALAAYASAQSSCKASGTLTVTNTQQLASVSGCSTYSGSIAIATGATAISLDGPKRITGDFITIPGGQLQTLEASDLQIVDGAFNIIGQPNLQSISMPSLREATTFTLNSTGQSLLGLSFGTPGLTQVTNFTIDGTSLQNLQGIDLLTTGSFQVTNNNFLTNLSMPLVNTTGDITIRGNPSGLSVQLNSLQSTASLLVDSVTSLSLNSLVNATGNFAPIGNSFTSLSLPKLTLAQGFTVQSNQQLTNLTAPKLSKVQSLGVNGNDVLTGIVSFPSLTFIGGAANLTGTFSAVTMSSLQHVIGTFYVASTNSSISSSCSTFQSESSTVFSISPTCSADANASQTPSGTTTPGSPSSSSTPNAALGLDAPENMYTVFGALAALFSLFL